MPTVSFGSSHVKFLMAVVFGRLLFSSPCLMVEYAYSSTIEWWVHLARLIFNSKTMVEFLLLMVRNIVT